MRGPLFPCLATAIAWVIGAAAVSPTAHAQADEPFALEIFEPLPGHGIEIFNVSTSEVPPHLVPAASLHLQFMAGGLTLERPAGGAAAPVEDRLMAEVGAVLGLFDMLSLGVSMPFVLTQSGADTGGGLAAIGGAAAGDLRLIPKMVVVEPEAGDGLGVHLVFPLHFPTGDEGSYLSDGEVRAGVVLGLDLHTGGGVRIAANLGYHIRPTRELGGHISDDQVSWALAAEVPVVDWLRIAATIHGRVPLGETRAPATSGLAARSGESDLPIEALLGVTVPTSSGFQFAAMGAVGVSEGPGAADARAMLTVSWTTRGRDSDGDGIEDADDGCPESAEDLDGYEDSDGCPDPDNDKDGVADAADRCPTEAEDKDGFEDDDGCADLDNDGDGIADGADKCPTDAEDKDGHEDEDGCPDPDNDGDGVLDGDDRCPDETGEGRRDGTGCIDHDRDLDGIGDDVDQCPDWPEVVNGVADTDGCPDSADPDVTLTATRIAPKTPIRFVAKTPRLTRPSEATLKKVAAVLRAATHIERLEIGVHTTTKGWPTVNRRVSSRQAEAVKAFLVAEGISADRLVATGFGSDKPLTTSKKPSHQARNVRVDLEIDQVATPPGPNRP